MKKTTGRAKNEDRVVIKETTKEEEKAGVDGALYAHRPVCMVRRRKAEARTAIEIASHHHENEDGNEEHVR